jgi:hypothetical protein
MGVLLCAALRSGLLLTAALLAELGLARDPSPALALTVLILEAVAGLAP